VLNVLAAPLGEDGRDLTIHEIVRRERQVE
jgi:hypothetical protein